MASKYPTFEVEQVKPAGYRYTLQVVVGRAPVAIVHVTAQTFSDAVAFAQAHIRVETAVDVIPSIDLDNHNNY